MKLKEQIDKILYVVLVFLMSMMVLNVLWQVASRFLLNSPSSYTDEVARFLLIWVSILGATYVCGKKMHLAIDLLPMKLKGKKAIRLNMFIYSLVALFGFFVFVWGGSRLVYITLKLKQASPSLNIPLGYIYMILPVSGIILIFYCLITFFETRPSPEDQGKELLDT